MIRKLSHEKLTPGGVADIRSRLELVKNTHHDCVWILNEVNVDKNVPKKQRNNTYYAKEADSGDLFFDRHGFQKK